MGWRRRCVWLCFTAAFLMMWILLQVTTPSKWCACELTLALTRALGNHFVSACLGILFKLFNGKRSVSLLLFSCVCGAVLLLFFLSSSLCWLLLGSTICLQLVFLLCHHLFSLFYMQKMFNCNRIYVIIPHFIVQQTAYNFLCAISFSLFFFFFGFTRKLISST